MLTAGFELGVNGQPILTTDPGNDDPWGGVVVAGSSTVTYDNAHAAHGSLSARCNGVAGQPATLEWAIASTTDHYGRFYGYFTGNPGSFQDLFRAATAGGASVGVYFSVISTGKIAVSDAGAGNVFNTTASIPLNQWFRVEYHVIHSTTVGQVELKLYNNPDDSIPTETQTSAASFNLNASCQHLGYAVRTGQTAGIYWMDDIVGNANSYPGPYASGFVLEVPSTPFW